MKKIIIIGAGGHGQVVADALFQMEDADPVAFLDENPEVIGKKVMGIPVPGGNAAIESRRSELGEYGVLETISSELRTG